MESKDIKHALDVLIYYNKHYLGYEGCGIICWIITNSNK